MSELPDGWGRVPLGDIIRVRNGFAFKSADFTSSGVPLIRQSNLTGQNVDLTKCVYLPERIAEENSAFSVHKGDLLIGMSGSIGEPSVYQGDKPALQNQRTALIVFRTNEPAHRAFIRYFLLLSEGDYTRKGKGIGVQNVSASDIESIEAPLPPLSEQRRIVAQLDSLLKRSRNAREELARIPRLVERYKEAILSSASTGTLTAKWRAAHQGLEPVTSRLKAVRELRTKDPKLSKRRRIATVPQDELPHSWGWISPDEVASDTRYSIAIGPFGSNLVRSDYRASGVRLVFVRDIRRESFGENDARFITQKKAAELHQHTVRGGDVLITKMGDPPGDTAIYPGDAAPAVITADCIKLTPHPSLSLSTYLMLCVRALLVRAQITEITMGVAHQKVSLARFRTIALPIPPLAEQKEIIRLVGEKIAWLENLTKNHNRINTLLDRLDQATLAKAFRGELLSKSS